MIDHTPAISERVAKRRDKYATEIVPVLPEPRELAQPTYVGVNSMTTQTKPLRRFLRSGRLVSVLDVPETPTAVARDYLSAVYGKVKLRARHAQIVEFENRIAPIPCLAVPTRFDYGHYIDLTACYWSVMLIAGWNVDYYPGKWLASGRPPYDFPFPDIKPARNALVSVAQSRDVPFYDPVLLHTIEKSIGNRFLNRGLYCLISNILHCLACRARELGAIYVFMDGYIFASDGAASEMAVSILDWGLHYSLKYQGPGQVLGVGSYEIRGPKGHTTKRNPDQPIPDDNLQELEYAAWLQRSFAHLAASHNERIATLASHLEIPPLD